MGLFLFALRNNRGSVTVMMAVAMVSLVGSVGVSVDMTRELIYKERLQTALDTAGLAAGSALFYGKTTSQATAQANQYFAANFSSTYLGVSNSAPPVVSYDVEDTATNIKLSSSAPMSTFFMTLLGIKQVNVGSKSQITLSGSGSCGQDCIYVAALERTSQNGYMNTVRVVADDGTYLKKFNVEENTDIWDRSQPVVTGIAVDSGYNVWVADSLGNLMKFSSSGTLLKTIDTGLIVDSNPWIYIVSVAVNSNDQVLVLPEYKAEKQGIVAPYYKGALYNNDGSFSQYISTVVDPLSGGSSYAGNPRYQGVAASKNGYYYVATGDEGTIHHLCNPTSPSKTETACTAKYDYSGNYQSPSPTSYLKYSLNVGYDLASDAPVTVDSQGNVWMVSNAEDSFSVSNISVYEFDSNDNYIKNIVPNSLGNSSVEATGIAAGSQNDLFILAGGMCGGGSCPFSPWQNYVQKYDTQGTYQLTLSLSSDNTFIMPTAIATASGQSSPPVYTSRPYISQ